MKLKFVFQKEEKLNLNPYFKIQKWKFFELYFPYTDCNCFLNLNWTCLKRERTWLVSHFSDNNVCFVQSSDSSAHHKKKKIWMIKNMPETYIHSLRYRIIKNGKTKCSDIAIKIKKVWGINYKLMSMKTKSQFI